MERGKTREADVMRPSGIEANEGWHVKGFSSRQAGVGVNHITCHAASFRCCKGAPRRDSSRQQPQQLAIVAHSGGEAPSTMVYIVHCVAVPRHDHDLAVTCGQT